MIQEYQLTLERPEDDPRLAGIDLSFVLPDGKTLRDLYRELPDRIPCIALHQPYAGFVDDGTKSIETREWEWPYGDAAWLAVYAAKHIDRKAAKRIGERAKKHTTGGFVITLVRVARCRPLDVADLEAAMVEFNPKLFAWILDRRYSFGRPIARERGPQKFVYLTRAEIIAALAPAPTHV
jgi:hypothetical protein